MYCGVCGLTNQTTSCGLSDCGLIHSLDGEPDLLVVAAEHVSMSAVSLYEKTGDIKDINTYTIPLSALKELRHALEQ